MPRMCGIDVPVDVRVEHTGSPTELREGNGEIRAQRRLADAALPRRDRDHTAIARQADHGVPLGRPAAKQGRQLLALFRGHDAKREGEPPDSGDGAERLVDLALEGVPQRAARDREHDRERDDPVGDLDVPHHVELRDRSLQLRGRSPRREPRGSHRAKGSISLRA